MKHKLLLVDDNAVDLESLREFLEKREFIVDTAKNGFDAVAKIKENSRKYSVIVLDYQMGAMNGARTTEALLSLNPNLLILIFSADPHQESVLSTIRNGAAIFVAKREGVEFFLRELRKLCARYENEKSTISDPRSASDNEKLIAFLKRIKTSGIASNGFASGR